MYLFVLINLHQWVYVFDGTNNLISFLLYSYCFLTFQQAFHILLVFFMSSSRNDFLLISALTTSGIVILIKRISCRIVFTCFDRLNKQSINIPKCWINHLIWIIIFRLCCYFRSTFVPRYCSFDFLSQVL